MLSNPCHGWCNVKIGTFEGEASYVTDVPINCLAAFIQYFDKNSNVNSSSIFFDEEGSEFIFILGNYESYVIVNRDEAPALNVLDGINLKSLVYELINDLEQDFEEWVAWGIYGEPDVERRQLLKDKINELKELIK